MSYLPSALKSRWPTMVQLVPTTATPAFCRICPPFISHIATVPPCSRHRMSLLRSKLKSWLEAGAPPTQPRATVTAVPADAIPLATTKRVLAPDSVFAATLKLVDVLAFGAIERLLWLKVRA